MAEAARAAAAAAVAAATSNNTKLHLEQATRRDAAGRAELKTDQPLPALRLFPGSIHAPSACRGKGGAREGLEGPALAFLPSGVLPGHHDLQQQLVLSTSWHLPTRPRPG
ncbi:hypothetical protein ANO11243_013760 [Dothideomycetidae sp. 11243]|nr:hypothetical protein ANO11243_013760 [fungal sp. No.11243]